MPAKEKFDLYAVVTQSILASLEKGVRPWTQPWTGGGGFGVIPVNADGKEYRGVNVWLLWVAAAEKGYSNNQWMSFKQAVALKGAVRKGEKSTLVTFFKPMIQKAKDEAGNEVEKKTFLLRYFNVFNVEQIDGLPERFYSSGIAAPQDTKKALLAKIASAEAYFTKIGGTIKTSNSAHYNSNTDQIGMPSFDKFVDAESYYATLGHEYGHWTGAEKRLNRTYGKRFGDEAYAVEELVAEMSSAFLCAKLGITLTPREDHAAYLSHWIKVLKTDKYAIFTASTAAQKAVEFLDKAAGEEVVVCEEIIEEREAA